MGELQISAHPACRAEPNNPIRQRMTNHNCGFISDFHLWPDDTQGRSVGSGRPNKARPNLLGQAKYKFDQFFNFTLFLA